MDVLAALCAACLLDRAAIVTSNESHQVVSLLVLAASSSAEENPGPWPALHSLAGDAAGARLVCANDHLATLTRAAKNLWKSRHERAKWYWRVIGSVAMHDSRHTRHMLHAEVPPLVMAALASDDAETIELVCIVVQRLALDVRGATLIMDHNICPALAVLLERRQCAGAVLHAIDVLASHAVDRRPFAEAGVPELVLQVAHDFHGTPTERCACLALVWHLGGKVPWSALVAEVGGACRLLAVLQRDGGYAAWRSIAASFDAMRADAVRALASHVACVSASASALDASVQFLLGAATATATVAGGMPGGDRAQANRLRVHLQAVCNAALSFELASVVLALGGLGALGQVAAQARFDAEMRARAADAQERLEAHVRWLCRPTACAWDGGLEALLGVAATDARLVLRCGGLRHALCAADASVSAPGMRNELLTRMRDSARGLAGADVSPDLLLAIVRRNCVGCEAATDALVEYGVCEKAFALTGAPAWRARCLLAAGSARARGRVLRHVSLASLIREASTVAGDAADVQRAVDALRAVHTQIEALGPVPTNTGIPGEYDAMHACASALDDTVLVRTSRQPTDANLI